MRAVAFRTPGPIANPDALADIELPKPAPGARDLLVAVRAVSVNPVDTKVRQRPNPSDDWKVLGYAAAGIVAEVGAEVRGFLPGDAVYYAGDITRPGSNAEFQLVDHRLAAPMPKALDFAAAAALPLTSLTAWEVLFDRLDVLKPVAGAAPAVLIIGAAGGVGSMVVQLARAFTSLTVVATASRPETRRWAAELGAHHVVDHARPLAGEVAALQLGAPGFVFSITHTDRHMRDIVELIAPQGRFALIDDPETLDILPFKRKSVSTHWESMFTRSSFQTPTWPSRAASSPRWRRRSIPAGCAAPTPRRSVRSAPPTSSGRTR
jgi:zinc-binding alcohol dehydrogenase family protein